MCLFQISTQHNRLRTRSETHGSGGEHREVRAAPAQPRMGMFCPRGAGEVPVSTFQPLHPSTFSLDAAHFLLTQSP